MTQEQHLKDKARLSASYKKTFSSDDGQEVLEDLTKSLFAISTTFDANNPHQTSFNEGRRSVLLSILNTMELDIGKYLELHRKAMEEQERFE